MKKISIIVPVYNVESYLVRSLDSIINQTYKNWECILVNDGSTDGSKEVCQKYVEKDNRFKLYSQKNSGSGVARTKGLKNATGEYICFIDPDDYIDTDALENNVKIANCFQPDIIANGYNEVREKSINEQKHFLTGLFNREEFRNNYKTYSLIGATALWNKLYRFSFLKEYNLTFTDQRVGQDALFNYEVYKYVKKIYVDENCYYYYDMTRDSSVVNIYNENRFTYEKNILSAFKDLLEYWDKTDEYENELLIREWNVLFNQIKNINLKNNPYSREQKIQLLSVIQASDTFQNISASLYVAQIPSRISQIAFKFLKNKRYSLLLTILNVYLKIRSYY